MSDKKDPTVDPKEVRAQLGLAENATDADVIAGLLTVIASLSDKYESLLAEAAGQDADLANRALDQYKDRIPEGTEEFWREQLIVNREVAVAVLDKMPAPGAAPAQGAAAPAPVPLKNRVQTPPARDPVPVDPKGADVEAAKAATIRNRATVIMRDQRIPWSRAFALAAAEQP